MLGYWKRLYNKAKTYHENNEGVAAIEFAFLAIPFFMLLFGIIELAVIFFINSTMTHSVAEAGRQIRTGNFQACGGADEFKQLVCANMDNIGDCAANLRVDVISAPTFKSIVVPEPEWPQNLAGNYQNTNAGDPVVVRALFYYKLALPAEFTRLETTGTPGYRLLESATAFRNEPFPAPGACPGP